MDHLTPLNELPPDQDKEFKALQKVRDWAERQYLGKGGNPHTFAIGQIMRNGEPTGEVGVIVTVSEKIPQAQLSEDDTLPKTVEAYGIEVPIDIQQAEQPEILLLAANMIESYNVAQGIDEWRSCHNGPLPGGVQIAPDGASWVGTLACACIFTDIDGKEVIGCLTNYHVAVASLTRGLKMGQPSGSGGDWFSKLSRWSNMQFNTSASNRVDGAVMDSWRHDPGSAKYDPGRHMVKPEQFKIGRINPNPVPVSQQRVGDDVQKSGRTTGHQLGQTVGIAATTHVGYGQGTARFVDQITIRGNAGDFSGPGDSGSLVLTMDNRPYGLLFAGGGGTTIINPIEFVQKEFGMRFF